MAPIPLRRKDLRISKYSMLVLALMLVGLCSCEKKDEAPSAQEMIRKHKSVRIGTEVNIPFAFSAGGTGENKADLQGFDIDVSLQIGLRLGVEPCFVTPSFLAVEAGNWGNMWDISVGSMRITPARMKVLAFTSPYYYEDGAIPLGIAIDHGHTLSIGSLVAALNQVVEHMHNDGTLAGLSIKWFGKDLSAK